MVLYVVFELIDVDFRQDRQVVREDETLDLDQFFSRLEEQHGESKLLFSLSILQFNDVA